jgi:creatinine amidohydrolase
VSAHEAIDRDFDAHLERIREFLRIPSVSAADGDLHDTADAVCRLIELAGGVAQPREPGEKRPTVIGVIDGAGPTVLRYGMYDVQPPGAQWTVEPFAAELRAGNVIARGAANSKGALAASILAFASAPSPCRQIFICEGEEELGSPRLAAFCDAHRDELAADFALDFDLQEEPGSVFAGVKGLYELELTAGGGPDVHSSRVAEVEEPAVDLARAVLALKDAVPAANVTWMRHTRGLEPHGRARNRSGGRRHPLRRPARPAGRRGRDARQRRLSRGAVRSGRPCGQGPVRGASAPRDGAEGAARGSVVGSVPRVRRAVRERRPRPRRRRPRTGRVGIGRGAAESHARELRRAGAAVRLRYEEHTWPELKELAERDDLVVVIPTATLEDHGYHLPVDTDARLVSAICERAVTAADGQALLFPTQVHGYTPHHMDFPGSVTLRWNVFVESLVDQGRSLCRHGFDRLLFVNGHGSNQPLVDIAARLIGVEHREAVCGSCFYLQSAEAKRVIAEVRDSPHPGGMAHACELETSLYLALEPELVQMDKAVREIPDWDSEHVWLDWSDGPLQVWPHWSGLSRSGVVGDATVATADKGERLLSAAVNEIREFIGEIAGRRRLPGEDHHEG